MKLFVLPLVFAAVAGQAAALSCIRPDPILTFQRVAAAPEPYYVLYGQLDFDQTTLPGFDLSQQREHPDPIAAQFTGKSLTPDGFTTDYASPVTLQISCVASWCGSARSGVDALYFVRADTQPAIVEAGPCGGMIFEQPDQATLDMLTSCMQGGTCSAQTF